MRGKTVQLEANLPYYVFQFISARQSSAAKPLTSNTTKPFMVKELPIPTYYTQPPFHDAVSGDGTKTIVPTPLREALHHLLEQMVTPDKQNVVKTVYGNMDFMFAGPFLTQDLAKEWVTTRVR